MHVHQPVLTWPTAAALLGAYFAGPIADVDQPQSYVGQRVWPLAVLLSVVGMRHRRLTHSLLFLATLWAPLRFLPVPDVVRWAVWIGYASHPAIDPLNEEGVELLWPWRFRVKLLPNPLAIPVESFRETVLRRVMAAFSALLFAGYVRPALRQVPFAGPALAAASDGLIRLFPASIQALIR
ncbi:metal-dependent hydrolase [Kyrpidia spormannii]|uniref:Metal-dependent hydrolase n=2 Tax=Kyrpidia spormannii TaxID=2055160 RepID=A0A2K8N6V3_9BACL|nr:metal-dependent hydrolase [Kyrpidia spormannii]